MKRKFILCLCFLYSLLAVLNLNSNIDVCADIRPSYMAIVIDDFGGGSRKGIEEMLSIDRKLTCAIMPNLENTKTDALKAYKNGHEVILHMPMEANVSLPTSWYGKNYIKNNDSKDVAVSKLKKALKTVPYAKGVNIHIGSGVSRNSNIISGVMNYCKQNNLYFCDSKTVGNSVCPKCAKETGVSFIERDYFLENLHSANYGYAKKMLHKGAILAKQRGYSVVIGHVGAEGGMSTYKAIKDSISEIENMGIKIVPLSVIVSLSK